MRVSKRGGSGSSVWGEWRGLTREGQESEEEMDGGRGRDVRKLRVEEVFYGAIGKEPEEQKEEEIEV